MSAESNIYDIEGQVEAAIAAIFTEDEVVAATSLTAPEFQKKRPRVEVVLVLGEGQGRWKIVNGQPRESAWAGQLNISCITIDQIATHTAFRVQVRATIWGIANRINQVHLPYHRLQSWFMDGGTSPVYTPEDGVYKTDMTFNVNISVQDDAWAAIPTTE